MTLSAYSEKDAITRMIQLVKKRLLENVMKHIKEITESFYEFSSEDLKLLRKKLYKTQQEMATLLAFKDRSSICFYEKGNKCLKTESITMQLNEKLYGDE